MIKRCLKGPALHAYAIFILQLRLKQDIDCSLSQLTLRNLSIDFTQQQRNHVCQHSFHKIKRFISAFSHYYISFFSLYPPVNRHYKPKQMNSIGIIGACCTERACAVSRSMSHTKSSDIFYKGERLQGWTCLSFEWMRPWLIDHYLMSFKHFKRPIESCQSFSILWFSCGFTVVLGQTQIIGFLNLRLSALPDRYGQIEIFPVQWINIKTTLPRSQNVPDMHSKAINPLQELTGSTRAYLRWHGHAFTYPED